MTRARCYQLRSDLRAARWRDSNVPRDWFADRRDRFEGHHHEDSFLHWLSLEDKLFLSCLRAQRPDPLAHRHPGTFIPYRRLDANKLKAVAHAVAQMEAYR